MELESTRFKELLEELERKKVELQAQQAILDCKPGLESIGMIITDCKKYLKKLAGIANEIAVIDFAIPYLAAVIREAEQREQATARAFRFVELNEAIKEVASGLEETEPCSIEQTQQLIKLSKLWEDMKNA